MTEETNPQNNQPPRAADQTPPEKPRRRKKTPPIDFNAPDDRDKKHLQNIAMTGARIAGRQQKLREDQLNAMKDTLADVLADADEADLRFLGMFFKVMPANATPAKARKIASHPLCPSDLAHAYRRDA